MPKNHVLVFDVGGTKTAWAMVTQDGTIAKQGIIPTASEAGAFLKNLELIADKHPPVAIGIGIAGTISPEGGLIVCTHIPSLSHFDLHEHLSKKYTCPIAIDNDARCALIGEVWKGAARDVSSAVLITLGTGVGGAVMRREHILPHPTDISLEISRIVADPTDLLQVTAGRGTVEALIGGKSLEERFGISLSELAADARKHKEDALETWKVIGYYFAQCIRAIYSMYGSKMIIVGGKGLHDLDLYTQDEPMPTTVVPARLGEAAGLVGAARLAWDAYEEVEAEKARDWDE